jgi:hypothetical protein
MIMVLISLAGAVFIAVEMLPRDGAPRKAPVERQSRRDWGAEPAVGRVAHGVPNRVDRLRCLGNAVVPQIPELIGRAIMQQMGVE